MPQVRNGKEAETRTEGLVARTRNKIIPIGMVRIVGLILNVAAVVLLVYSTQEINFFDYRGRFQWDREAGVWLLAALYVGVNTYALVNAGILTSSESLVGLWLKVKKKRLRDELEK